MLTIEDYPMWLDAARVAYAVAGFLTAMVIARLGYLTGWPPVNLALQVFLLVGVVDEFHRIGEPFVVYLLPARVVALVFTLLFLARADYRRYAQ